VYSVNLKVNEMVEFMPFVNLLFMSGMFIGIFLTCLYWLPKNSKKNTQINKFESTMKFNNQDLKNLKENLEERETNLDILNAVLNQREEAIKALNADVKDRNDTISDLKQEVDSLEEKNHNLTTRAETAEEKVDELEHTLIEKENEISRINKRTKAMQDNYTIIYGIGPKVSSVLRNAGINSFSKLADMDVAGIKDILLTENPNLTRLTDPSTWPEQASMAANEEWESLKKYQEEIKKKRRVEAANNENVDAEIVEIPLSFPI